RFPANDTGGLSCLVPRGTSTHDTLAGWRPDGSAIKQRLTRCDAAHVPRAIACTTTANVATASQCKLGGRVARDCDTDSAITIARGGRYAIGTYWQCAVAHRRYRMSMRS